MTPLPNKDRRSFHQRLTEAELLARLGSWSPVLRERAAAEFAARKAAPLAAILALLDSPSLQEFQDLEPIACDVVDG